jgi:hypothetical protein
LSNRQLLFIPAQVVEEGVDVEDVYGHKMLPQCFGYPGQ